MSETILEAIRQPFAITLNALARQGKLEPAEFAVEGKRYKANCAWAACEHLAAMGVYERKALVEWFFRSAGVGERAA